MRMRNSSSSRKVLASDKEYEVAEILLCLPVLLSCFKPSFGIASLLSSSCWGFKRKRSAIGDDKEAVAVVKKRIPTTRPLSIPFSPSQSNPPSSKRPRCNSVSQIKTKEELLKKVDELTNCRDSLKREIGKVRKYYEELLTTNSSLKAMRHQQQSKKCCMDPIAQSCQALPAPKASDPPGGKPGLNMSYNGLAIDRAMDPSSWPLAFELGVGQVNKCQATEPRRKG